MSKPQGYFKKDFMSKTFEQEKKEAVQRASITIHETMRDFNENKITLENSVKIYLYALNTLYLDGHAQGMIKKQTIERIENEQG